MNPGARSMLTATTLVSKVYRYHLLWGYLEVQGNVESYWSCRAAMLLPRYQIVVLIPPVVQEMLANTQPEATRDSKRREGCSWRLRCALHFHMRPFFAWPHVSLMLIPGDSYVVPCYRVV